MDVYRLKRICGGMLSLSIELCAGLNGPSGCRLLMGWDEVDEALDRQDWIGSCSDWLRLCCISYECIKFFSE